MSVELWNYLHDGTITAIEQPIAYTYRFTIEIAYLRAMFPQVGEAFLVTLTGCDQFQYKTHHPAEVIETPAAIAARTPHILMTYPEGGFVTVFCDDGIFTLRYDTALTTLEDGTPVPLDQLGEQVHAYWHRRNQQR